MLSWSHVRVFSPWKYNIDKVARELLEETDWNAPKEDQLPTRQEMLEDYFFQ